MIIRGKLFIIFVSLKKKRNLSQDVNIALNIFLPNVRRLLLMLFDSVRVSPLVFVSLTRSLPEYEKS